MAFSYKLGCLPENVLQTLLNDRLVAKGSVMGFVTTFFQVRQSQNCSRLCLLIRPRTAEGPRSSSRASSRNAVLGFLCI
jgi:hypothetical protein